MKILSISVLAILIVIQSAYFQRPEAAFETTMMTNKIQRTVAENEVKYSQMLEAERRIQFEISLLAAENFLLQGRQMLEKTNLDELYSHDLISRQNSVIRYNKVDSTITDQMDSGFMVLSETEDIIAEDTGESADETGVSAGSGAIRVKAVMKTGSITLARVTAYAPFDNRSGMCNDGNPNSTSTGQRPGPSIVAVDPKKIPYGTQLKIKGFKRVFTAGDTGSILRRYDGIAIDVFFDTYTEARRFGVQYLEVEILN